MKDINNIKYASETLLNFFLSQCNEDQVDGLLTAKFLLPIFQDCSEIFWLDIGCGPANKIDIISKYFSQFSRSKIRLTAIDKSKIWKNVLYKKYSNKDSSTIFENYYTMFWNGEFENNPHCKKYNVISFMHSLYGLDIVEKTIPAIKDSIEYMDPDGIVIIIIESQNSDSFHIKNELLSSSIHKNDFHYIVESTLSKADLVFSSVETEEQEFIFNINDVDKLSATLQYLFILDILEEYFGRKLHDNEKFKLTQNIIQRLKTINDKYYLSMPDRIFFACRKGAKIEDLILKDFSG